MCLCAVRICVYAIGGVCWCLLLFLDVLLVFLVFRFDASLRLFEACVVLVRA